MSVTAEATTISTSEATTTTEKSATNNSTKKWCSGTIQPGNIVLVEQNFRFAAPLADRHYVMEHGQIVATVHKNELDNKAQMLNEYLGV